MPLNMKLPENTKTPGFFSGFNYLFAECLFHTNTLNLHSPPLPLHTKYFPYPRQMYGEEKQVKKPLLIKDYFFLKSLTKLKMRYLTFLIYII